MFADAEQSSIGSYITHSNAGESLNTVLNVKIGILNSVLEQAERQQKEKCSKRAVVIQLEQWGSCFPLQYRKAQQLLGSSLAASIFCSNPVPTAVLAGVGTESSDRCRVTYLQL